MAILLIVAVLFLAAANGSNDNFKGVATIYGSRTASYRACLAWATVTTLAGSLTALALASGLVKAFSAKGLVPDATAALPAFRAAVVLGAAVTVAIASRIGMPISTTHALTGALVGCGLAAGAAVNPSALGKGFVLPLLLSPVLSLALAAIGYAIARAARRRSGVVEESCVCVEDAPLVAASGDAAAGAPAALKSALDGEKCAPANSRVTARGALDRLHFLSAGAVGFARGLNDTPKIVALVLAAQALRPSLALGLVGVVMAVGGLLGARRVAETMSNKIVAMNAGQGFTANLVTAALVIAASRFGLPVSTTHVATGGLFGIGVVTRTAKWRMIASILTAWVTTLPVSLALAALAYRLLA